VTAAAWALFAAAGMFAAGNWLAASTERRPLEYVCKPATLGLLVATAVTLHPTHHDVRGWFVAGLVLSLAGDVFLMLPEEQFVAGLASFLLGHIAYVVGFALEAHSVGWAMVGLVLVLVAVAVVGRRVVLAVRGGGEPELLGPVVVYLLVISAMVVMAWSTTLGWAIAGAVLFYASDATLAWNKFVRPIERGHLYVMITYHLGQAGLVLALTDHLR
jgi:uncharacterized membrane protein YhhN